MTNTDVLSLTLPKPSGRTIPRFRKPKRPNPWVIFARTLALVWAFNAASDLALGDPARALVFGALAIAWESVARHERKYPDRPAGAPLGREYIAVVVLTLLTWVVQ
jgi:hypothetical protein